MPRFILKDVLETPQPLYYALLALLIVTRLRKDAARPTILLFSLLLIVLFILRFLSSASETILYYPRNSNSYLGTARVRSRYVCSVGSSIHRSGTDAAWTATATTSLAQLQKSLGEVQSSVWRVTMSSITHLMWSGCGSSGLWIMASS